MTTPLLHRIRRVVVVASSPRGGSSLLAEHLRSCPDLVHLPGETPPLLTLAGLDPVQRNGSEVLTPEDAAAFSGPLAEQLALELGNPSETWDPETLSTWLLRRLSMQWPDEEFPLDQVRRYMQSAASSTPPPSHADEFSGLVDFHLEFIAEVRKGHPSVNPYYYDIAASKVSGRFPDLPVPQGPPGSRLVEVPPFLIARPWRPAAPEDLERRTLVVKAPGCSYQIPFFQALFPNAQVRVLHLTRAPGPSVNGLISAWHHRGFFSRRVSAELSITGYSDAYPDWGTSWWNFDCPPGWTDMVKEPLAGVCAFQWHSAHRAALQEAQAGGHDVLRLRHEDFVGTPDQRRAATHALGEWLDLPGSAIDALTRTTIGPVSAVTAPNENRWLRKRDLIAPFLVSPEVHDVSAALGYDSIALKPTA
ncbi:sulfotransferase [Streptomyces sioyaensis]|uniref:sulfotransferase n=1 Tax=Streptomyces sioyaensis TaxID=67364 RepID=UPI0033F41210